MNRKNLKNVWYNMRKRCYKQYCKEYKYYGARGIKICEEWEDRKNFEQWALSHGYDDGLQIDRIDNDGDYTPENCRFVTPKVNANNRRNPNIVYFGTRAAAAKPILYNGEMVTIAELSRRWNIPYSTIKNRQLKGKDLLTGADHTSA